MEHAIYRPNTLPAAVLTASEHLKGNVVQPTQVDSPPWRSYLQILSWLLHSRMWFVTRGNTAFCVKLSGEDFCCVLSVYPLGRGSAYSGPIRWGLDLLRYSIKIELAGLRRCPYYHYLSKKVMTWWQTSVRACPTSWRVGKQLA